MNLHLKAKVAVVTGAANGIGKHTAKRLAQEGAKIALVDISDKAGEASAAAIRNEGGEARFFHGDVSNEQDISKLVDHVTKHFGQLNLLVNNAGITRHQAISDMTLADWHHTIDLNLTSIFLFAKYCQPHLAIHDDSAIVNVASLHANSSISGLSAYAASKAGIVAFSRNLALEFAPSIRVNSVLPGLIETESWLKANQEELEITKKHRLQFHPLERIGNVEDVSAAIAFLLSKQASFITGQSIVIDGGLSSQLYR